MNHSENGFVDLTLKTSKKAKVDAIKRTRVQQQKDQKVEFTFQDLTQKLTCTTPKQVKVALKEHGVALYSIFEPSDMQAALIKEDPIAGYNAVLKKKIDLSTDKLYGQKDLTKDDLALFKWPGFMSGMFNWYSGSLHQKVIGDPKIYDLFDKVIYPDHKEPNRAWPQRLRVQLPGQGKGESSHFDWNGTTDRDLEHPTYGTILCLNDGRPFEFCQGTFTRKFFDELNSNYSFPAGKHYHQLHLETAGTPDPLHLRSKWARVVAPAGSMIIFNDAMVHRIAPYKGKKAVWSMFLTVKPQHPGYDDPENKEVAVPALNKRTEADRNFMRSQVMSGVSQRTTHQRSALLNIQTWKWPSGKKSFYYSMEGSKHVHLEDQHYYRFLNKEGDEEKRPRFPSGMGCTVDPLSLDQAALDQLRLPPDAFDHLWALDPLQLSDTGKHLMGFIDLQEQVQPGPVKKRKMAKA